MRGHPVKTPERVAEAIAMRERGVYLKDIAEHFGIKMTTAHSWVSDPDGSRVRARKESYAGACVDCGAPTNGYAGPGRASERCIPCAIVESKVWTRAAIILAIRDWADAHGGVPPTATDWRRAGPNGEWPPTSTVVRDIGWADAIEAAGFPRPLVSHYGRDGEDMDLCREIADRYIAGESAPSLARAYDCGVNAIFYRLRKGGATTRTALEAARLRDGEAA